MFFFQCISQKFRGVTDVSVYKRGNGMQLRNWHAATNIRLYFPVTIRAREPTPY